MMNRSQASDDARAALSSLMDGELPAGNGADAFAAWRRDGEARASWHAYHLIGDVLRSDDLAVDPSRDERFLQSLRARLADEPVPLAPAALSRPALDAAAGAMPSPAAAGGRRGWASSWMVAPAAVAAGFVVVAGVLVASRLLSSEPAAAPVLAAAPTGAAPASGTLVRDARLDRYLAAHRSLANSAMAAGRGEQRVQIVFEGR